MSEINSYKDLIVWQKSMDMVEEIYLLTKSFPRTEEYRMTAQMTRAAVSVPANIAEGHTRATRREYAQFISIARGSLAEVETYLILATRLGFTTQEQTQQATQLANEVGRMLTSLRLRLMG